MTETQIKFKDGGAYERYMGVWSRMAGEDFLNWLAPARNLQWLDVGCGSGAFTQLIAERCAPKSIEGIDPSEEQLAFARAQPALRVARFQVGDAMKLPFPENSFDAAVQPLVIFFVPDPLAGVKEMARVVRPGGIVAAYGWDLTGGGFPYFIVQDEMQRLGEPKRQEPSPAAADMKNLERFWAAAGLRDVETREIHVRRTFASADEFWSITRGSPNIGPLLEKMRPDQIAELTARVAKRAPADSQGRITLTGRANAVKGTVGG